MEYLLPHHPSLASLDPLDSCSSLTSHSAEDGYLETDDGRFTHATVIKALLYKAEQDLALLTCNSAATDDQSSSRRREWSARFGELLQDIAYSLHGVGDLSTGYLEEILMGHEIEILKHFQLYLFKSARSMTDLFPTACLAHLSELNLSYSFTPPEIDALLAHLLLGTVQIPKGNDWGRPGFTAWYQSSPAVPSTVTGYLLTLTDHFAQGGYVATVASNFRFQWLYSLTSADISPTALAANPTRIAKVTPAIKLIASEPTPDAPPSTFVLLSAHSQPGPGPAGTHEERLMGQSLALAITSLLCPKLERNVALVTSSFPVHAAWEGHNRYAKLIRLFDAGQRVFRRYIIADAAELDVADHSGRLPDLKPGVVEREVGKLQAGFGGAVAAHVSSTNTHMSAQEMSQTDSDFRVEVVPWGCQAFGGNLVIKAQCMMLAGGLAGVRDIQLLVTADRTDEVREITSVVEQNLTVGQLYLKLRSD